MLPSPNTGCICGCLSLQIIGYKTLTRKRERERKKEKEKEREREISSELILNDFAQVDFTHSDAWFGGEKLIYTAEKRTGRS